MYKSHRRMVSTMLIAVTFAFKSRFLHCRFHREDGAEGACRCDNRHFLSHLYVKRSFLPRQARDIRRESSTQKKSGVFADPPDVFVRGGCLCFVMRGQVQLKTRGGNSAVRRGHTYMQQHAIKLTNSQAGACCHDRVVTDLWLMTCD